LISCVVSPGGASTGEVDLTWTDNSTNETSFSVERSTNGVSYLVIATLPANTTAYPSMQNQPGDRWWRVRAANSGGNSGYSNVVTLFQPACATPTPTPTATPTATPTPVPTPAGVVATAATNITTVSFQANWNTTSGATGYRIDVSTDSGFAIFVPGYQNLDVGNVLLINVTGLNPDTTYYYRVRAYNAGGLGAYSNIVTTGTLSGPTPTPTAPGSPTPTPTPSPVGTPNPPSGVRVGSSPPP
jgi:hypothetical protein